jgi:hypothetical protein
LAQDFTVHKLSEDERLVFGWASVCVKADGTDVIDSQDDKIATETLEKAAYKYVLKSRDGGLEHKKRGVATLVESFLVTKSKLSAMGLAENALPEGWWVGFKVEDSEVWKKIKSGELSMFSIGGKATKRPVE